MRTLEEVKDRCFIDEDGHWIWRGGVSSGNPRIHAPDWTLHDGAMTAQNGKRAVWHIQNGKPIPEKWRVFGKCQNLMCVNPDHIRCGPASDLGKLIAKTGNFKNKPARIVANRLIGQKLRKLSPEQIDEVLCSGETDSELAERLGVNRQVIYRVRRGRVGAFRPAGSPFAGLGAR